MRRDQALRTIDRLVGDAARVGAALATAAAVHAGSGASAQMVLHVDDDAAAGGDGRSWATAYRDLQQALDAAALLTGSAPVIKIAQGVYRPDRGTGDRVLSFAPTSGLVLMGGFAGLGTNNPDAHDPDLFKTVLSGDLAGDDGPDFMNRDDNAEHVVQVSGSDMVVFHGLTIRGGHATWSNGSGGIDAWVNGGVSTIALERCRLSDNMGVAAGGAASHGTLVMVDSVLEGNLGSWAGGVRAKTLVALRAIMGGNSAPVISATSGASAWLDGCVLSGKGYGAVAGGDDSMVSVRGCTVVVDEHFQSASVFEGNLDVRLEGSVVTGGDGPVRLSMWRIHRLGVERSSLNVSGPGLNDAAVIVEFGANLLFADPKLASPRGMDGDLSTLADNDFGLRSGSPAIDFGDARILPRDSGDADDDGDRDEPAPWDVLRRPRLMDDAGTPNQGLGAQGVLDLGALEFQGVSCRVDLDGSGLVGVGDWFVYLEGWFVRSRVADFDRSGQTDLADLHAFLAAWFAGCD